VALGGVETAADVVDGVALEVAAEDGVVVESAEGVPELAHAASVTAPAHDATTARPRSERMGTP
jgi:hypothetical protein